jgi:hypothetical protein
LPEVAATCGLAYNGAQMESRRLRLALALILALGIVLRFASLDFGLDAADPLRTVLNNVMDERGMVESVRTGLLTGSLHPGDFLNRGAFAYYLFGLVDAAYAGALSVLHPQGWVGVLADLEHNPSALYLLHRGVTALAGVLTILLLVHLVRRELDEASALLAGLFLATGYLHVILSHTGLVDVIWALVTTWALERMLLLLRAPTRAHYVQAGLVAGLAAATKYFSVLLGAHLLVAHLFARAEAQRAAARPPPHARLLLGWALCPVGFFLAQPGLLPHARDFLDTVLFQQSNFGTSFAPVVVWQALDFHVRWTFVVGLGEPVFLLALAGAWLAWRRGAGGRFLVLSSLLFTPTLFLTLMVPVRYGALLIVLLAGLAGIAARAAAARVPRWVAIAALAACVAPSLVRAVIFDRLIAREDTRTALLVELRERGARPDEVLGIGVYGLPIPPFSMARPYVPLYRALTIDRTLTLEDLLANPPRYVFVDLSKEPFEEGVYEPLRPALAAAKTAVGDLLATRYREVLRLDGRDSPAEVPLPDPVHGMASLMVPYAEPWRMSRPGPGLVLYERAN